MTNTRKKKPAEAVIGTYTPIPHSVLDSTAFMGASDRAKAMMFELLRQHTGRNNGHLQLAVSWLNKRGWKSADQIQKAKSELLERGLVVKTKLGGMGIGPDHYALTWLVISDFTGLDMKRETYHPGLWREMDPLPPLKNARPLPASAPKEKCDAHTATRNNSIPAYGTGNAPSVPPNGTETTNSGIDPVPRHGNNECCQLPTARARPRIVGKKGHSGKRKEDSHSKTTT